MVLEIFKPTFKHNLLTPEKDWADDNYWREKGQPCNCGQIIISGGHEIQLFAWRQPDEYRIADLYKCIVLLPPKLVLPTSYILFDDADMANPYDPSDLCTGYRRRQERAIQFYPHAYTSTKDHKGLSGVSIWQGAIIHEFAHNQDFYPKIIETWIQEFGWVKLDESKVVVASDGSRIQVEHECLLADKLITQYAGHKPSEDFCESMVAALFCPERLDSGKLAFIQQYFGD